jgi:hypothetical protein
MANSLYAVKETGRCHACGFLRDSANHFRTHIPRNKWPESMGKPRKARVVVGGKVYDVNNVRAEECGCTWVSSHPEDVSTWSRQVTCAAHTAEPWSELADRLLAIDPATNTYPCLSCDYVAKAPHGLLIHRGKAHRES